MGKKIKGIIFSIYLAIALVVTLLLLGYNDFKITEIGKYSLLLITDDELAPEFNKGDLVILNKDSEVLTGQKAFFYNTYNQKIEVRLGEVVETEKVNDTETTYTFEGDRRLSSQYVLGPANTAEIIPHLGSVLSVLESKWGFLFIIVFPILILSINQISKVCSNILKAYKESILEEAKREVKKDAEAKAEDKE
ncbi:MAG: hypothetical protein IJE68_00285 [Clostridia bacterium]|nr:hypothetical protein [Clostridia bacterium]